MNEFSITILGSSAAVPTSSRFSSAQIVSYQFKPFLVDCGEGTQIQLRKNKIRFSKINHIFISHMHGDHFFGLIGLISSFNLLGRKNALHIFAPQEIKNIIDLQLSASQTIMHYDIVYHFLQFDDKQLLYETQQLEIFSFPLIHSIPTCGFLFKEKPYPRKIRKEILVKYEIPDLAFEEIKNGKDFFDKNGALVRNELLTKAGPVSKSYAYCSDTIYAEKILNDITDVDLLYHECSFMEDMRQTAEDKMHSTTLDAARIASEANTKKLIIGHFSARYKDLEPVLAEAQTVFSNTILAIEGLKVDI